MKPPRQPLIYITVFLLLTLFLSLNVKSASTPTFKCSPQVAFKLSAYNTIVKFADWAYFDSFSWDKWNASSITFYNLHLEGETNVADAFSVSIQNANMTITQLLKDKEFHATLNGQSGTLACLTVSCSIYDYMPRHIIIGDRVLEYPLNSIADFNAKNEDCWYYNPETNGLYIKATLHSPVNIIINWNIPSMPVPAPTPTPPPAPVPAPTPAPAPTPTTPFPTLAPPEFAPLILLLIAFILFIGWQFKKHS